MNKKLVALCLCVAILASALTAGTLAYFTSTDGDRNTFTTGNVKIEQIELERTTEGSERIVEFEQDQVLVPSTMPKADIDALTTNTLHHEDVNGMSTAFITAENGYKNIVDKIVQVKNTGSLNAYVGTIFAVEDTTDLSNLYRFCTGGYTWKAMRNADNKSIVIENADGVRYMLYCYVNAAVVAPGEYATPGLSQVLMRDHVTQEEIEAKTNVDGKFEIIAVSFGVQADGFTSADEAVTAAFGFEPMSPSTAGNMRFQAKEAGMATLTEWFDGYTFVN